MCQPSDIAFRFRQAVEEFNGRLFFECHETLEAIWMEDPNPRTRLFFQGLIQVAVGFYHLGNLNFKGSRNLLERGVGKLSAFAPTRHGVDLNALISAVETCRSEIERLGREGLAQFDVTLVPTITLGNLDELEAEWNRGSAPTSG
jgi:predicted metal-dependent hydrolase